MESRVRVLRFRVRGLGFKVFTIEFGCNGV